MRLLFREEDIFIASRTKCVHKLLYIKFYDANFLYMDCYVSSHFPNLTRSD